MYDHLKHRLKPSLPSRPIFPKLLNSEDPDIATEHLTAPPFHPYLYLEITVHVNDK